VTHEALPIFGDQFPSPFAQTALPGCKVFWDRDRVTNDFPSQQVAHPSYCACFGVPEDDKVVGLVCNDKILAFATN
jgi:hypothetical protein